MIFLWFLSKAFLFAINHILQYPVLNIKLWFWFSNWNVLLYAELGLLMKSCIDQGQLVPDDVISRLILSSLRTMNQSSWLLDGKAFIQYQKNIHFLTACIYKPVFLLWNIFGQFLKYFELFEYNVTEKVIFSIIPHWLP